VFPENFEPVTLNASEQDSLNNKLNTLGIDTQSGRTLRVNAGVELCFANGRPLVKLKGVSLMGVPIPNAWLGNLKNVDLINEFGANPGFWQRHRRCTAKNSLRPAPAIAGLLGTIQKLENKSVPVFRGY
jgi:hypothetical protein